MSKDMITSRRSFLKSGAIIAAPLAVVATPAVAALGDDGSKARLPRASRTSVANKRSTAPSSAASTPAAAPANSSSRAKCRNCRRQRDRDRASMLRRSRGILPWPEDGARASGRFACTAEFGHALEGEGTFVEMAWLQGNGPALDQRGEDLRGRLRQGRGRPGDRAGSNSPDALARPCAGFACRGRWRAQATGLLGVEKPSCSTDKTASTVAFTGKYHGDGADGPLDLDLIANRQQLIRNGQSTVSVCPVRFLALRGDWYLDASGSGEGRGKPGLGLSFAPARSGCCNGDLHFYSPDCADVPGKFSGLKRDAQDTTVPAYSSRLDRAGKRWRWPRGYPG